MTKLLFAVVVLLTGSIIGLSAAKTIQKTEIAEQPPITVKLTSDKKSYARGETVKFTVTVQNTSDKSQTLNFRSGQTFDITALPAKQTEGPNRWNWSHDMMFTQALREVALKPGESQTYNATWNQKTNEGKEMPRGDIVASAQLTADQPAGSQPLTISLTD